MTKRLQHEREMSRNRIREAYQANLKLAREELKQELDILALPEGEKETEKSMIRRCFIYRDQRRGKTSHAEWLAAAWTTEGLVEHVNREADALKWKNIDATDRMHFD